MTIRKLTLPSVVFCALLAAACGEKNAAPAPSQHTVRGLLKSVPGADGKVMIHHEAIPDFVAKSGKKVGMVSMTMPFALTDATLLENIAPGDKVEFSLAVDWSQMPPTKITAVKKLPADTELELTGR